MPRLQRAPFAGVYQEEAAAFVFTAHGPPLAPADVEQTDRESLEVRVFWGRSLLATRYLESEGAVVIGDHPESMARIPQRHLGSPAFELARATRTGFVVQVPAGASGQVRSGGEVRAATGPRAIDTSRGDVVTMEVGSFLLEIIHGAAARAVPKVPWLERMREIGTTQVTYAALLHALLFGVFAYDRPLLADDTDDGLGRHEQIALMRRLLTTSAEREHDAVDAKEGPSGLSSDRSSGGARAEGNEGSMGRRGAPSTNRRWGKWGPTDNKEATLDIARGEAATFGMIGLLAQNAGDMNAPTANWGPIGALGRDPLSALGGMWSDTIGESGGNGGLGPSGVGFGGGGDGRGISIDPRQIAGIGLPGDGSGSGRSCPGCSLRGHVTRTPAMREGTTIVSGHLPAEVIQRVVRDNFGRFRSCYESGLRENPGLEGRVVTRFAVDRQGMVTLAEDGGSSLPNQSVVGCIVKSFYSLSFPEHEGGIVSVVYPLVLRPD